MGVTDLYIDKCTYGYRVWVGVPGCWGSILIGWRTTRRGARRLAARTLRAFNADPELYR